MRRIVGLTALLLASACGQAAEDSSLGTGTLAIVNGVESSPEDDTAVFLFNAGGDGYDAINCTATVIAPNLVATALHCITRSSITTFSCQPDGSLTDDTVQSGRVGPTVEADKLSVKIGADVLDTPVAAHGAQVFGTGSTQICRADIGFVMLDRDLDVPITPVRLDYGVEVGDMLDIMGYGVTEEEQSSGRHKRTGVRVLDVGPDTESEPTGTAAPRTFVVGEGPCHGDSGGPAIAQDTGALVGVYSLAASSSCVGVGARGVYTNLWRFANIARQAFEAAGHEPILDEAPLPPESPDIVSDTGCSMGSHQPGHGSAGGALALAALGVGVIARRRRARSSDPAAH